MTRKINTHIWIALAFLLAFGLFTILIMVLDVKPIGPEESLIGFAQLNENLFHLAGTHPAWQVVTDGIGIFALLIALLFCWAGLYQWIKRKSIRGVDRELLLLGICYLMMLVIYVFFEKFVINYRPVLHEGKLEASYPSSHTMIVLCIMGTGRIFFRELWGNRKKLCTVIDALAFLIVLITVLGRFLAGIHWFTDIVGGILISASLVEWYHGIVGYRKR